MESPPPLFGGVYKNGILNGRIITVKLMLYEVKVKVKLS